MATYFTTDILEVSMPAPYDVCSLIIFHMDNCVYNRIVLVYSFQQKIQVQVQVQNL